MKTKNLSIKELAAVIGVSTDTIRQAARKCEIPATRIRTPLRFGPELPIDTSREYPAPLQGTRAEDFVLAEGFEGGDGHTGDGNRVAQRVKDFDGVPLCAVRGHVMIHQFHDVATTETMLWDIALQHHIRVEIKLHSILRLSGISVTNFVTPDKFSVIQMVCTASATPFGPDNMPRIS